MNSLTHSSAPARHLYDQAAMPGALGAWECQLSGEALTWTDGVYDLFGFARQSTLYRSATLDHYHEPSRREMQRLRSVAIQSGKGFALDCQIRNASGQDRWMRLVVGVGREQGRIVRIFGSKQDVTAEKAMWGDLATLTRNDPLTGLASRRVFEDTVRDLAGRHAGTPDGLALAVFDIDGFAVLNERLGKAGADECLRGVATRLERLFLDALIVSRIGPDQFAVLLPLPGGKSHLSTALDGARRLLSRPIPRGGAAIEIGISAGAAMLKPAHRDDPRKLVAEAESALYVAKAAGRNCVRIFDGLVVAPSVPSPSAELAQRRI